MPRDTTYSVPLQVGKQARMSDPPADYISLRVTCPHDVVGDLFKAVFLDTPWFIYALHLGKQQTEHVHMLAPGTCKRDAEKYRYRMSTWLKLNCRDTKMKKYSADWHNGVLAGIQYLGHEATEVLANTPDSEHWVSIAPPWVPDPKQTRMEKYARAEPVKPKDRDWMLTYSNLVVQAVNHHRQNSMDTTSLKVVVRDMITKSKWRPSRDMLRGGVPEFYDNDFKFRIGHTTQVDMSWWEMRDRS